MSDLILNCSLEIYPGFPPPSSSAPLIPPIDNNMMGINNYYFQLRINPNNIFIPGTYKLIFYRTNPNNQPIETISPTPQSIRKNANFILFPTIKTTFDEIGEYNVSVSFNDDKTNVKVVISNPIAYVINSNLTCVLETNNITINNGSYLLKIYNFNYFTNGKYQLRYLNPFTDKIMYEKEIITNSIYIDFLIHNEFNGYFEIQLHKIEPNKIEYQISNPFLNLNLSKTK